VKKIVFLLFLISFLVLSFSNNKNLVIPHNAIRIRVIANSNDVEDQRIKINVKNDVTSFLEKKLSDINSYNEASGIIRNNLNDINDIVKQYESTYDISYGKNYFPKKVYKGIKFNEGEYNSIVIKLGEAKGNNLWCVIFPPLCLVDENTEEKDYQFYFLNLLKKIK